MATVPLGIALHVNEAVQARLGCGAMIAMPTKATVAATPLASWRKCYSKLMWLKPLWRDNHLGRRAD